MRWLTDETNSDPAFARNRVRQHLLPVLRTYNPAVDEALSRLAETIAEEEQWIDAQVERTYRRLLRTYRDEVSFELRAWRRQPLAVRRRLVLRVADDYGIADVGFDAVERALAVAETDGPARAELGGGLTVGRTGERLRFRREGSA
jgi:tRNA(Ile)-lysidine synthase